MSSIVVLDSGIDPREKQKSGRIEKQEAVAKTIADEKKKKAASGKTNYQAVKKAIGQKHTSKNEAYFSRKELEELANKLISPEEDSTVVELKKQLEVSQDEIKRLKQQLEEKEIELLASPTNGALLIIAKAYEGYKKEKPKATKSAHKANHNGLVVRLLPIVLVSSIQLSVIALLVSMGGII